MGTLVALAVAAAVTFPHGTATITNAHGRVTLLHVEIAETEAQQAQGLMHRRRLARQAGMAFVFPSDTRGVFWMKDTWIPLSIAFARVDGRIVRVLDMAPCRARTCRTYDPGVSFRTALEVNRGAFRRWGVGMGDRLTLRRLKVFRQNLDGDELIRHRLQKGTR